MTDTPPPSNQHGWGPPPEGQPAWGPPAGGPPAAKKPLWKKKRFFIPVGILALFIIGGIAGGGSKSSDDSTTAAPAATSSSSAPATSAAPAPAATSAAPPAPATTAAAPPAVAYAGKLKEDKLAGGAGAPGSEVQLSGWTTTASALDRVNTGFSKIVCSTVTLANRDSKAQDYNITSWKLQTPGGNVQDVNFQGDNLLQPTGSLINAGTVSGSVCFDDPAQPGQYVLSWQPDQFSSKARGVWLNAL